jgi:hypothetical protein
LIRYRTAAHFLRLFDPPPVPTPVFCGNATPLKSKAEMAALAEQPGIDLRWMSGSLGPNEEYAQAITDPILGFVAALPARSTGRQQRTARKRGSILGQTPGDRGRRAGGEDGRPRDGLI